MNLGSYPAGTENDPMAPWNEPLPVIYKRRVTLTASYYMDLEGSPYMDSEQIEDCIREDIKGWNHPKDFWIDDLIIEEV